MSKVKMPEPAVVTTGPGPDDVVYSFTSAQMEAYAAARVRDALEEAAQACEARVGTGDPGIYTEDFDEEARECAAAIRALIPSTPA